KVVLLDCLSGFVSNLLLQKGEQAERATLTAVAELLESIREAANTVIVVSNEVGNGVVPPYPLGRHYRDMLGLANQKVASAADAVSLLTVGIPQTLKGTFPEVQLDA
ncbi:MAG: bifunctional adenosylcobinamide kinase/adenosylcobinamide-phosphate guanylyltransferase, partial [Actinomycetota bacterium]